MTNTESRIPNTEGLMRWLGWPGRAWQRFRWWLGEASTSAGRTRLMERSGFQGAYFHSWMFPITRHGKLLLCAFAFTALPAGISVDVPMYEVTVGVVCLLLVATGVGSWYRLAKMTISGGFPTTVVAGETLVGRIRIENHSPVSLFDVAAGCFLPPRAFRVIPDESVQSRIPPGGAIEVSLPMTAEGRGRFRLPPVRAFTLFPFAIGRTEVARLPWSSVLVLPRIPQVTLLETAALPGAAQDESQLRRGRSDATEYMGGREYVPGDEPRLIDHRAWARTGRLVVREWGVPAQRGRIVVLDARWPDRLPQPWPGLARAIDADSPAFDLLWPMFRPLARTIWAWGQGALAVFERLLLGTTLRRYGRRASDAAASLVAGMLHAWTSRHEPCELVCGGDAPRQFDLGPARDAFDAAWEHLGELTFTTANDVGALRSGLGEALERGGRSVWVVTCRPDAAIRALITELGTAGNTVQGVAIGVAGEAIDGFCTVPITAVRGGAVHVG